MSRESEKVLREMHEYVEKHKSENLTQDELHNLIDRFMEEHNMAVDDDEYMPEDSYDYLDMAYDAETDEEALKLVNKALKLDPLNYDALAFQAELKSADAFDLIGKYEKLLKKATENMTAEGYFSDEYIGSFWDVLETRPYMRLRHAYMNQLLLCGMITRAGEECEELLRLCENDNLGVRYTLMHIYATLEDEESAQALYKRFDSYDETQMLLPLSIVFFKKGEWAKSRTYLKKLLKANKDTKRFFNIISGGDLEKINEPEIENAYRPRTIEELIMEYKNNIFCFTAALAYIYWAVDQIDNLEGKGK